MNIALFDFDGTITNNDNYTRFLKYSGSKTRKTLIFVPILPIYLLYKFKIISSTKARSIISFFAYKGRNETNLGDIGLLYSRNEIPKFIRKNAIDRINWHKSNHDLIVVVSASLNIYLNHWCNQNGLDIICTILESKNGILTGRYQNGDCTGQEKARRVIEKYDLKKYQTIYVYGDTTEDRKMFDLGNAKYYRWEQVDHIPLSSSDCDKRETI